MKQQIPLGLIFLLAGCADPTPSLDVTASKGRDGIAITNRSRELVTDCTVRLFERDRDEEWAAGIPKLSPMDTHNLAWISFFTSRNTGTPVPTNIGMDAKRFTVSCFGPNEAPRSAELTF